MSRSSPLLFLDDDLKSIRQQGLLRQPLTMASAPGTHGACDARDVIMLASNNYLGLANDRRVRAAAVEAIECFGAGTGGSRLTTGTLELHLALEEALARFKHTEAALLFNTGYMANVGIITALCGQGDVIFSDALNHASIIDGCRQSRADVVVYAHNDMSDLEQKILLRKAAGGWRRGLVVSDSVFSMDGDIANVPALARLAHSHNLPLMLDEAHATGVIGQTGHGSEEYFSLEHAPADCRPDIVMGTLSKALGSEGGFVCGPRRLIAWLQNSSRSFIFSTALPAASVAAAHKALEILVEEPQRVARLRSNIALFCRLLNEGGIPAHSPTAIVPVIVGDEKQAVHVAQTLLERGCFVSAIRYPSVARGRARLRFALCSEHGGEDLAKAAASVIAALSQ